MPPLSSQAISRSILDSATGQIAILFRDGIAVKSDTIVVLHGSATNHEQWSMDRRSDIDLIIVQNGLTRSSLDIISGRLACLAHRACDFRVDMRVGPISFSDFDAPVVNLQVQVIPDLNLLSPVSRQILHFNSQLLAGTAPPPFDPSAVPAGDLQHFMMRDLRAARAMAIEAQVPFWQWSASGPLLREFRLMSVEGATPREKLRRHAARLLRGWAGVLMLRGADHATIGPDDVLALAGAVRDPRAFAALWAATPGLDEEAGE